MWINILCYHKLCLIMCNMENVHNIDPNISTSSPQSPEEKHTIIYVAAVFIIAFIGVIFYIAYNNAPEPEDVVKEERIIYTNEEKLQILEGLASSPPEDIPSIEERKEILSKISESKPANAREYSKEEKLNILYSLQ